MTKACSTTVWTTSNRYAPSRSMFIPFYHLRARSKSSLHMILQCITLAIPTVQTHEIASDEVWSFASFFRGRLFLITVASSASDGGKLFRFAPACSTIVIGHIADSIWHQPGVLINRSMGGRVMSAPGWKTPFLIWMQVRIGTCCRGHR